MTAKQWRLVSWVGALVGCAALIIGVLDGDPGWGFDLVIAAIAFVVMVAGYVMEARAKRAANP